MAALVDAREGRRLVSGCDAELDLFFVTVGGPLELSYNNQFVIN